MTAADLTAIFTQRKPREEPTYFLDCTRMKMAIFSNALMITLKPG